MPEPQERTPTSCRICIELEQFLQSAKRPESPDLLAGLSEAGKRNRIHQRQEKILKTEADIGRHKKSCLHTLGQVEQLEQVKKAS